MPRRGINVFYYQTEITDTTLHLLQCDRLCGPGKQTRNVTCHRKNKDGKIEVLDDSACSEATPEREKACELRPCEGVDWVTSDWTGVSEKFI